MELDEELIKQIEEWSEGNEYLYTLLYLCWEKSIKTYACCKGHEKRPYPYIGIILDNNSIPYVESIISMMEKVENIVLTCDYRHHSNMKFRDGVPEDERKVITIYCQMHNRCEVFFKLACAINGIPKKIQTAKGEKFYQSFLKFMRLTEENIREFLKNGSIVGSSMSTITDDYRNFSKYKKKETIYGNTLLQFFSKKIREKDKEYRGKYAIQNEYDTFVFNNLK